MRNGWDFSNPHFPVLTRSQDRGIPQDPATSQTSKELHRLESQCLEKCDPVGHPCILMGSSRDKWPLSALGEIITQPSKHTGTSVPAVKGATPLQMRQAVFSAWSSHCKGCIREWFPLERAARSFIPAFLCCFVLFSL